jgi:hypothetical protein
MKITIAPFDPDSRTVQVQFEHGAVTHLRPVNACLDEAGEYDAAATQARVEEVALGVEQKIELGLITVA